MDKRILRREWRNLILFLNVIQTQSPGCSIVLQFEGNSKRWTAISYGRAPAKLMVSPHAFCLFALICTGKVRFLWAMQRFVEDKRLGEQAVCWRAVLPFRGTLTGCRNEFMWISWGSVKANMKSSLWDIMTPFVSCVTALTRSQHVPLQHRRPAGCISTECRQWCERSD